jgi:ABC-2 type transport system ATP-binding protein
VIEFTGVTRSYDNKPAVTDLNLSVPGGELFALLGPNGAGKTTTIKMMVGLLRPSAGDVQICGFNVVDESRHANRHTGYVPDEPQLYDKLSGREFLNFVADMHGLERPDAAARLAREIQNFELESFVDDRTETYSHGMKQRLALAAALLHDPRVLVVDEPTVGLDPRSVRMVKDLLRAKARRGMTIFMSTHSLSVVEEIADRIGILVHGRMRFLGTIAELRRQLAHQHDSLEQLYLDLTDGEEEREQKEEGRRESA